MNRKEFMEQLRRLLYDIPASDREEALDYYESYFDDAGDENEASVIRELGSPGRIAAEIKAGLQRDPEAGEYTDTGYHNKAAADDAYEDGQRPVRYGQNRYAGKTKKMDSGVKTLLLIGLAVVTFPIWGSLLGVLASVVLGILATLLGLICGTLFGGIGLIIGSIAVVVFAASSISSSLSLGIAGLGIGMIAMAIGLLLLVGFGWLVSKAVPALIRFFVDLFYRIFHRNRGEAAS